MRTSRKSSDKRSSTAIQCGGVGPYPSPSLNGTCPALAFGYLIRLLRSMPAEKKRDYYESLGVTRGAADEESSKRLTASLAIQFHPDRNPGNKARRRKFQGAQRGLPDPLRSRRGARNTIASGTRRSRARRGRRLQRLRFQPGLRGSFLGHLRRFLRHRARPLAIAHPARRRSSLRSRDRIRGSRARRRKIRQVPAPDQLRRMPRQPRQAAAPPASAPAPTAAAPARSERSRVFSRSRRPAGNAAAKARSSPTRARSVRGKAASASRNRSRCRFRPASTTARG